MTEMSLAGLRTARSPARTTAWSSTSSTRITSPGMGGLRLQDWRAAGRHSRRERRERDAHANRGPAVRRRYDLERAVGEQSTLAHREQAHRWTFSLGARGIEAHAVVVNVHADGSVGQPNAHFD